MTAARIARTILEESGELGRKLAVTRDQPDVSPDLEDRLQALSTAGFDKTTPFENLFRFSR